MYDLEFAIVVGVGFLAVLMFMCIATWITEKIIDTIERRRRRKFRKGYIDLKNYYD